MDSDQPINNSPVEEPPQVPLFQTCMNAQAAYQAAIQRSLAAGNTREFNPLMMFLTIKTLVLELTALRELVFDIVSLSETGVNNEKRLQLIDDYFVKQIQIFHAHVALLEQGPRILKPS